MWYTWFTDRNMRQFFPLIFITTAVVAIAAIVRYMPARTIVIERVEQKMCRDTVRIFQTLEGEQITLKKIELNSADSTALRRVYGIGAKFSSRIVKYRNLLGGYHQREQLREVYGITEEVYQKIVENFWVDTLAISKININFATLSELKAHPYIDANLAGRLARAVKLKGGYSKLSELIEDKIITQQEAEKIAPYLSLK